MRNLILVFLILTPFLSLSQTGNVGINTSNPHPNSILEMVSSEKGLLIPRMTSAERVLINPSSGAEGLMVYDNTTSSFWYWNNFQWVEISAGTQGSTGPTGAQGIQGLDGLTGLQGMTGSTGAVGPQGNAGPAGVDGQQGIQGPTGSDGVEGQIGSVGSTGPTGADGQDGSQGLVGLSGVTGPTGLPGQDGLNGQQGVPGLTGPIGPTGVQGFIGSAGPTGPDGIQGLIGSTGSTGVQGIPGLGIAQVLSLDVDTLSISDGNSVILSGCPTDAVSVNKTLCIDVDVGPYVIWRTAVNICFSKGGYLCSWQELDYVCRNQVDIGVNNINWRWQWTGDGNGNTDINVTIFGGTGDCSDVGEGTVGSYDERFVRCCYNKASW
jgi:hypothetical protein